MTDDEFPPLTATKIAGHIPIPAELLADAATLFTIGHPAPPEPEPSWPRRWWRTVARRVPRVRLVWPGDDDAWNGW